MSTNTKQFKADIAGAIGLDPEMGGIEIMYPKVFDPIIPLSQTGVTAYTFYHWKKNNLIPMTDTEDENQQWVKLNLAEFLWVKFIEVLRNFGVSVKVLQKIKHALLTDVATDIGNRRKEFADTEEMPIMFFGKAKNAYDLLEVYDNHLFFDTTSRRIYRTEFGLLVSGCYLLRKNFSINLSIWPISKVDKSKKNLAPPKKTNKNPELWIEIKSDEKEVGENNGTTVPRPRPYISIPVMSLLEDFFSNEKNNEFASKFELITIEENALLEIIRKKDFKEISIKLDGPQKSFVIDITKDADLKNEKVAELRRILGLKEYQEINIVFRNNKHAYIKNKIRKKI